MEDLYYTDAAMNPIKVGDVVLVRDSQKDATYRMAVIRGFREDGFDCRAGNIQIEYTDGRLYCNMPWYDLNKKPKEIRFHTKPIKVWRWKDSILKFKPEYITESENTNLS